MRRTHKLSRRMFLSEFGRNTLAVTVLGSGLVACGGSGDSGGASAPDPDAAGASTTDGGTGTTAGSNEDSSTADTAALRWERVDFDFVSAYVLARGDEVAIVDTGTSGGGGRILAALDVLGLGWDDVDHVIVTHAHGDHYGGLDAVMAAAPAATGYAGTADLAAISAPRDLVALDGGEEVFGLEILATPGHTPGHICAFDPDSGLFLAGDAMVTTDGALMGPVERFSSDIAQARESVKAIADTPVSTILVGHGDPVTEDASNRLAALAADL